MPKIKLKRGLETNLPVLDIGEPGFTTDTGKLFVGGTTGNVEIAKKEDVDLQFEEVESSLAQKVSYPILTGEVGVVDKKQPYGNVVRYGAVPVWTSDANDTTAFQNAVESANALGIPVYVPHGEFSLKSTVYLYPNTKIVGVGFNNPIGSRINTSALEVFKPKTSSVIRLEMSGIVFINELSTFSIVFSQMDLATSIIQENTFNYYNVLIYGKLLQTSSLSKNQIKQIKYKMITGTLDVSVGLPVYSGAITDSRITLNYINGSRNDLAYVTDVPIATSNISNNYIDFFYIAFYSPGNDGAVFTNNTIEYCWKMFAGRISSTVISNNDIRHCKQSEVSNFTNPTATMINNPWKAITISDLDTYGSVGATISNNIVSYIDTFFEVSGILTRGIKSIGNTYVDVTTPVSYVVGSGWGDALKNMYIEEIENAQYTTFPNPNLTGAGIISYYNHHVYYNGKRLRNDNGTWKDMMGVTVSS
jgi:hypothetical protein